MKRKTYTRFLPKGYYIRTGLENKVTVYIAFRPFEAELDGLPERDVFLDRKDGLIAAYWVCWRVFRYRERVRKSVL